MTLRRTITAALTAAALALGVLTAAPAHAAQGFEVRSPGQLGTVLRGEALGAITFRLDGKSIRIDRMYIYDSNPDGYGIAAFVDMVLSDGRRVDSRPFLNTNGHSSGPVIIHNEIVNKALKIEWAQIRLCARTSSNTYLYCGYSQMMHNPNRARP